MPVKTSALEPSKPYILKSYQDGSTFASLGKEFNCSECTMRNFIKKHILIRDNPKKPKHYEAFYDKITELYYKEISAYQMSIDLDIPIVSIARILKKLNLDISHRSKIRTDFIKNHEDEIVSRYLAGESEPSIAKSFNCHDSSICRVLQKYNIETRYNYSANHSFFSQIDNEVKAYIWGYFTADGCNVANNNSVNITSIDLDILERMKIEFEYDGPIYLAKPPKKFPDRQGAHVLSIGSPQISQDLTRLGCMPNKTFLTTFPSENLLQKHLQRHFIRGLLDGDGSIFHETYPRIGIIADIAGTKPLLDPILDIIRQETGITGGGVYKHENISVLKISGNPQVLKFLDWLYADSTIHLARKHSLYTDFRCKYYEADAHKV